jgi:hypothetical protein
MAPVDPAVILRALFAIGGHRNVPVSILSATTDDQLPPSVLIGLRLRYLRATPVCCGEPGCYIPFLGVRRREVPIALQMALHLAEVPNVTIRAELDYESGYEHTSIGSAVSQTVVYGPEEFGAAIV